MERASGLRKLDYLSFTLKEYTSPEEVIDQLGTAMVPVPHGRFGYQKMALAERGGLAVMWDGFRKEMGVHVQMSGKGCNDMEFQEGFESWQTWIDRWFCKGAKVTRMDLAIDDVSGAIAFDTVMDQVNSGLAMTRAENGGYHVKWDRAHRYQTLYVGDRKSDTLMRCYDKGLQLRQDSSWLRFEFEHKGAKADGVAHLLVNEGWDAAVGVGRSFIEFKDPEHKVSEKTRQRPAKWWVDLMDASKHVVRLPRDKNPSMLKALMWLKRQASPSLATILEHEGGDLSWLLDLVKEGQKNMKDRHRRMLLEGMN